MRTSRLLAVAALACLAVAGCGTSDVTTTPDVEAAERAISAPSTPATAPPKAANVGDTITVAGLDPKLKVSVQLRRVIDPALPTDDFFKPKQGQRYYAVEFVLKNQGEVVYDDSPSNGTVIIDSEGQQYSPSIIAGDIKGGVQFNSLTVSPGDKRRGLVAFDIPKNADIDKVQLSLNSGFATQTAEWRTR